MSNEVINIDIVANLKTNGTLDEFKSAIADVESRFKEVGNSLLEATEGLGKNTRNLYDTRLAGAGRQVASAKDILGGAIEKGNFEDVRGEVASRLEEAMSMMSGLAGGRTFGTELAANMLKDLPSAFAAEIDKHVPELVRSMTQGLDRVAKTTHTKPTSARAAAQTVLDNEEFFKNTHSLLNAAGKKAGVEVTPELLEKTLMGYVPAATKINQTAGYAKSRSNAAGVGKEYNSVNEALADVAGIYRNIWREGAPDLKKQHVNTVTPADARRLLDLMGSNSVALTAGLNTGLVRKTKNGTISFAQDVSGQELQRFSNALVGQFQMRTEGAKGEKHWGDPASEAKILKGMMSGTPGEALAALAQLSNIIQNPANGGVMNHTAAGAMQEIAQMTGRQKVSDKKDYFSNTNIGFFGSRAGKPYVGTLQGSLMTRELRDAGFAEGTHSNIDSYVVGKLKGYDPNNPEHQKTVANMVNREGVQFDGIDGTFMPVALHGTGEHASIRYVAKDAYNAVREKWAPRLRELGFRGDNFWNLGVPENENFGGKAQTLYKHMDAVNKIFTDTSEYTYDANGKNFALVDLTQGLFDKSGNPLLNKEGKPIAQEIANGMAYVSSSIVPHSIQARYALGGKGSITPFEGETVADWAKSRGITDAGVFAKGANGELFDVGAYAGLFDLSNIKNKYAYAQGGKFTGPEWAGEAGNIRASKMFSGLANLTGFAAVKDYDTMSHHVGSLGGQMMSFMKMSPSVMNAYREDITNYMRDIGTLEGAKKHVFTNPETDPIAAVLHGDDQANAEAFFRKSPAVANRLALYRRSVAEKIAGGQFINTGNLMDAAQTYLGSNMLSLFSQMYGLDSFDEKTQDYILGEMAKGGITDPEEAKAIWEFKRDDTIADFTHLNADKVAAIRSPTGFGEMGVYRNVAGILAPIYKKLGMNPSGVVASTNVYDKMAGADQDGDTAKLIADNPAAAAKGISIVRMIENAIATQKAAFREQDVDAIKSQVQFNDEASPWSAEENTLANPNVWVTGANNAMKAVMMMGLTSNAGTRAIGQLDWTDESVANLLATGALQATAGYDYATTINKRPGELILPKAVYQANMIGKEYRKLGDEFSSAFAVTKVAPEGEGAVPYYVNSDGEVINPEDIGFTQGVPYNKAAIRDVDKVNFPSIFSDTTVNGLLTNQELFKNGLVDETLYEQASDVLRNQEYSFDTERFPAAKRVLANKREIMAQFLGQNRSVITDEEANVLAGQYAAAMTEIIDDFNEHANPATGKATIGGKEYSRQQYYEKLSRDMGLTTIGNILGTRMSGLTGDFINFGLTESNVASKHPGVNVAAQRLKNSIPSGYNLDMGDASWGAAANVYARRYELGSQKFTQQTSAPYTPRPKVETQVKAQAAADAEQSKASAKKAEAAQAETKAAEARIAAAKAEEKAAAEEASAVQAASAATTAAAEESKSSTEEQVKEKKKRAPRKKKEEPTVPMTACPNCGASMPAGSVVCPSCGYNVIGKGSAQDKATDAIENAKRTAGGFFGASRLDSKEETYAERWFKQNRGKRDRTISELNQLMALDENGKAVNPLFAPGTDMRREAQTALLDTAEGYYNARRAFGLNTITRGNNVLDQLFGDRLEVSGTTGKQLRTLEEAEKQIQNVRDYKSAYLADVYGDEQNPGTEDPNMQKMLSTLDEAIESMTQRRNQAIQQFCEKNAETLQNIGDSFERLVSGMSESPEGKLDAQMQKVEEQSTKYNNEIQSQYEQGLLSTEDYKAQMSRGLRLGERVSVSYADEQRQKAQARRDELVERLRPGAGYYDDIPFEDQDPNRVRAEAELAVLEDYLKSDRYGSRTYEDMQVDEMEYKKGKSAEKEKIAREKLFKHGRDLNGFMDNSAEARAQRAYESQTRPYQDYIDTLESDNEQRNIEMIRNQGAYERYLEIQKELDGKEPIPQERKLMLEAERAMVNDGYEAYLKNKGYLDENNAEIGRVKGNMDAFSPEVLQKKFEIQDEASKRAEDLQRKQLKQQTDRTLRPLRGTSAYARGMARYEAEQARYASLQENYQRDIDRQNITMAENQTAFDKYEEIQSKLQGQDLTDEERAKLESEQKQYEYGHTAYNDARIKGDESAAEMRKVGQAAEDLTKPLMVGEAALQNFGNQFNSLVGRFNTRLIRQAFQQVKQEVVQFANQMNQIEMIKTTVDSGVSRADMAKIEEDTMKQARELKTSASSLAKVKATLYRQGLTDAEVNDRAESVVKFSAVTGQDASAATKYLTAAVNSGLVDSLEEAMDVMAALGDTAATTAEEISKAMQKSASSASLVGVEYEELAAMITAITSGTQLGGTTAGTALNTLFTRMNRVTKTGYASDVNGESTTINDVEAALSNVGIDMRDSSGEFRDTFDVIKDIVAGWQYMSDTQQRAVLYAMGGTRQQNTLSTMFSTLGETNENGQTYLEEYLETASGSSGTVDTKYGVYTQSVEASTAALKTAFTSLVDAIMSSQTVISVMGKLSDAFTDFADVVSVDGGEGEGIIAVISALAGLVAGVWSGNMTVGLAAGTGVFGISSAIRGALADKIDTSETTKRNTQKTMMLGRVDYYRDLIEEVEEYQDKLKLQELGFDVEIDQSDVIDLENRLSNILSYDGKTVTITTETIEIEGESGDQTEDLRQQAWNAFSTYLRSAAFAVSLDNTISQNNASSGEIILVRDRAVKKTSETAELGTTASSTATTDYKSYQYDENYNIKTDENGNPLYYNGTYHNYEGINYNKANAYYTDIYGRASMGVSDYVYYSMYGDPYGGLGNNKSYSGGFSGTPATTSTAADWVGSEIANGVALAFDAWMNNNAYVSYSDDYSAVTGYRTQHGNWYEFGTDVLNTAWDDSSTGRESVTMEGPANNSNWLTDNSYITTQNDPSQYYVEGYGEGYELTNDKRLYLTNSLFFNPTESATWAWGDVTSEDNEKWSALVGGILTQYMSEGFDAVWNLAFNEEGAKTNFAKQAKWFFWQSDETQSNLIAYASMYARDMIDSVFMYYYENVMQNFTEEEAETKVKTILSNTLTDSLTSYGYTSEEISSILDAANEQLKDIWGENYLENVRLGLIDQETVQSIFDEDFVSGGWKSATGVSGYSWNLGGAVGLTDVNSEESVYTQALKEYNRILEKQNNNEILTDQDKAALAYLETFFGADTTYTNAQDIATYLWADRYTKGGTRMTSTVGETVDAIWAGLSKEEQGYLQEYYDFYQKLGGGIESLNDILIDGSEFEGILSNDETLYGLVHAANATGNEGLLDAARYAALEKISGGGLSNYYLQKEIGAAFGTSATYTTSQSAAEALSVARSIIDGTFDPTKYGANVNELIAEKGTEVSSAELQAALNKDTAQSVMDVYGSAFDENGNILAGGQGILDLISSWDETGTLMAALKSGDLDAVADALHSVNEEMNGDVAAEVERYANRLEEVESVTEMFSGDANTAATAAKNWTEKLRSAGKTLDAVRAWKKGGSSGKGISKTQAQEIADQTGEDVDKILAGDQIVIDRINLKIGNVETNAQDVVDNFVDGLAYEMQNQLSALSASDLLPDGSQVKFDADLGKWFVFDADGNDVTEAVAAPAATILDGIIAQMAGLTGQITYPVTTASVTDDAVTVQVGPGTGQLTTGESYSGGSSGGGGGKSKAEKLIEKWQRKLKFAQHEVTMNSKYQEYYETTGELSKEREEVAESLPILKAEADVTQEAIDALTAQLALTKEGSDDWYSLTDAIQEYEESLQDINKSMVEAAQKLKELDKQILETQTSIEETLEKEIKNKVEEEKAIIEGTASMEQTIVEMIKQRYQDEWDLIKEDIEKKKEALEEEKSLIEERLQMRKNSEDEAAKYEELAEYQKQLALVEMDSTRTKDAAELRKKIADLQSELSWSIAESEAEAQTSLIDDQIEAYDDYTELGDERLASLLEDANNFSSEVTSVLEMSYEDMMNWLSTMSTDFANSLAATQDTMLQTWEDTYKKMMGITDTYWDEVADIMASEDTFIAYMKTTSDYVNASEAQQQVKILEWQELYEDMVDAFSTGSEFYGDESLLATIFKGSSNNSTAQTEIAAQAQRGVDIALADVKDETGAVVVSDPTVGSIIKEALSDGTLVDNVVNGGTWTTSKTEVETTLATALADVISDPDTAVMVAQSVVKAAEETSITEVVELMEELVDLETTVIEDVEDYSDLETQVVEHTKKTATATEETAATAKVEVGSDEWLAAHGNAVTMEDAIANDLLSGYTFTSGAYYSPETGRVYNEKGQWIRGDSSTSQETLAAKRANADEKAQKAADDAAAAAQAKQDFIDGLATASDATEYGYTPRSDAVYWDKDTGRFYNADGQWVFGNETTSESSLKEKKQKKDDAAANATAKLEVGSDEWLSANGLVSVTDESLTQYGYTPRSDAVYWNAETGTFYDANGRSLYGSESSTSASALDEWKTKQDAAANTTAAPKAGTQEWATAKGLKDANYLKSTYGYSDSRVAWWDPETGTCYNSKGQSVFKYTAEQLSKYKTKQDEEIKKSTVGTSEWMTANNLVDASKAEESGHTVMMGAKYWNSSTGKFYDENGEYLYGGSATTKKALEKAQKASASTETVEETAETIEETVEETSDEIAAIIAEDAERVKAAAEKLGVSLDTYYAALVKATEDNPGAPLSVINNEAAAAIKNGEYDALEEVAETIEANAQENKEAAKVAANAGILGVTPATYRTALEDAFGDLPGAAISEVYEAAYEAILSGMYDITDPVLLDLNDRIESYDSEDYATKHAKTGSLSYADIVAGTVDKQTSDSLLTLQEQILSKRNIRAYATGGLADSTGLAWLDGTTSAPEYVLNAEQTAAFMKLTEALCHIMSPTVSSYDMSSLGGNSNSIGDVNVTINGADINSDADIEALASRVGEAFAKELSSRGFHTTNLGF